MAQSEPQAKALGKGRRQENRALAVFLVVAFGVPCAAWIGMNAAGLYGSMAYQGISALLMFAPMLASLAAARL